MVPKSEGYSLLNHNESVKVSGTKRLHPDSPRNSPHLVYVRRKPLSRQNKNTTSNTSKHLPIKLCENEKNREESPMKDSTIQIPEPVPDPETCTEGVSSNTTKGSGVQYWEERFLLLQNFLKVLDQPTQDDYHQMLWSLSSADLSRLAVELERRTIQLSSEEAKEVQRAKLLDVEGIPAYDA